MKLEKFEREEIQAYFKIDEKISNIEERIKEITEIFYSQTMSTRTESDGKEIYSRGFNMDRNVVLYLDTILARERTIEILRKRKSYLNNYLNSLDPLDKKYLIDRYKKDYLPKSVNSLDKELYLEILEINEAINNMYGYPPDLRNSDVTNDYLESDFDKIADMLGV
ncbi:hypothetical protein [Virgibacillus sp. SK37]|uniref:hypothetical protein n=1 Tax=Virgibacillus sp. SK37 TaxID=403957 RepID=UPI0011A780BB|nr:hypothetical protein [Virgibacillus sp. SK37]